MFQETFPSILRSRGEECCCFILAKDTVVFRQFDTMKTMKEEFPNTV